MRLTVCALSAVLLSGCSWMGTGGNASSSYGCGTQSSGGQYAYNQAGYGAGSCGGSGAYGVAANGYGMGAGANGYGMGAGANGYGMGAGANGYGMGAGANGYGMGAGANGYGMGAGANGYGMGAGANGYGMGAGANGYGMGAGANGYGMNAGANGYGMGAGGQGMNAGLRGAYGAGMAGHGGGTVLGGAAPYGAAVGGSQYASAGQYINGQWVAGSSSMTTVQGAPIYVPQPYPAYYGVGYNAGQMGGGLRGASAALPFGIEASAGREFYYSGDTFGGAGAKPSGTNHISALDSISYKDAYSHAETYGLTATYDVDPSTTLLGTVGWSKAEGERMNVGTITNASGSVTEDLYAQWGNLEEVTLEGGVRKYMGGWNNRMSGVRPYVQATAGFAHNNSVDLVQDSATLAPANLNTQQYIDDGWTPTASGMVGAEMQVGARTAIGVETGVRWRDNLDTNLPSEDRWSIPLNVRGRVSF